MQLDNPKFTDPVAALINDVRSYLARNHVTQKALATLAGTTEQALSDFLGKRERGFQAETFGRIQYLVSNNIVPVKVNRIVQHTSFGQPVPDIIIDKVEYETKHTEDHTKLIRLSGTNRNAGSTYEIPQDNRKNL